MMRVRCGARRGGALLVLLALAGLLAAPSLPLPFGHPSPFSLGKGEPAAVPGSGPPSCGQGNHTLQLAAQPGDMHDPILQAYDTLGAEGGGTLSLGPGTFTINETLDLSRYGNVTIEGQGMGVTVLSLPPAPVGNFRADNGTPVGRYNSTLGEPVNGSTVNFIQVLGPKPIDNLRICDLTLDAQATSPAEDWSGSLFFDNSGGTGHWYVDVQETNLFGADTAPNGLHLERPPGGGSAASGYWVDRLMAGPDTVPYEQLPGDRGGPNFLNLGGLTDCRIDNVTGLGMVEFDLSPLSACTLQDWNITGHLLLDPDRAASWNGTIFQNVSADIQGTAAPNALDLAPPFGTPGDTFHGLLFRSDTFVGPVLGGGALCQVESSRFLAGLNATPPIFVNNTVVYNDPGPDRIPLPLRVGGSGALETTLRNDTFRFPNGTKGLDPFLLESPVTTWDRVTLEVGGTSGSYLLAAPGVILSANSSFTDLTYHPLDGASPPELLLVDLLASPGFEDQGASTGNLTGILNDLPTALLPPPSGPVLSEEGTTSLLVSWAEPAPGVTNYTLYVGSSPGSLTPRFSVGPETWFRVPSLTPGTRYYFAVQAWRGPVASPLSNLSSFVTASPSPMGPPLPMVYTVVVGLGLAGVVIGGTSLSLRRSRRGPRR